MSGLFNGVDHVGRGAVGGLPFPSSRILLAGFADFGFYARVK